MRKTLLSMVALLASGNAAMAQNGLTEIPDPDGSQLMCTVLSPNGKYIGGVCYGVNEGFIYDTQTRKMVKYEATDGDPDTDIQLKAIADNGVAVGWNGPAAIFDFAKEKCTTYGEVDQYLFAGISPNGRVIVGARYDGTDDEGTPCLFNEGVPTDLPQPSDKFLGAESAGASALSVSNDSIITGYWVDAMATRPALLWTPNRDGKTFSAYPFSRGYFAPTNESTMPYGMFSCDQTIMSANGKYVVLNVERLFDDESSEFGVARFNTENDSIEYFMASDLEGVVDASGSEMYGFAVSDDGTIVGCYGGLYTGRTGFIWKKGEKLKSLVEAFPTVGKFAEYDAGGMNSPCGISADGRYIAGFAFVDDESADEDSEEAGGMMSWFFDTQYETTGVASAQASEGAGKLVARFSADGKRLNAGSKVRGFNMLLMKNGKTMKTFNK